MRGRRGDTLQEIGQRVVVFGGPPSEQSFGELRQRRTCVAWWMGGEVGDDQAIARVAQLFRHGNGEPEP